MNTNDKLRELIRSPILTGSPSDLEKQGWEWLESMVSSLCAEEPSDISYSADQMVDAFIAGAVRRKGQN